MHKVKAVWLAENETERKELGDYATGMVLELEDGRKMVALTTDPIQPFTFASAEALQHEEI